MIRKQIVYRIKADVVLDTLSWSAIRSVPKDPGNDNHGDKDPYAIYTAGDLELFWSSNRGSAGWSLWRSTLTDATSNSWSTAEQLTTSQYAQSAPIAIAAGTDTYVLYRSNQHVQYSSNVYRKTQFNDFRYSGSITLDVRNREHINRMQSFEDAVCYTYDTGSHGVRDDSNRIARDTLGVFLDAGTYDVDVLEQGIQRLRPVVREFMPITDRAVFIPATDLHSEMVYAYAAPSQSDAHFITEQWFDDLSGVLSASALAAAEDFTDELDGGTS